MSLYSNFDEVTEQIFDEQLRNVAFLDHEKKMDLRADENDKSVEFAEVVNRFRRVFFNAANGINTAENETKTGAYVTHRHVYQKMMRKSSSTLPVT